MMERPSPPRIGTMMGVVRVTAHHLVKNIIDMVHGGMATVAIPT